MEPRLATMGLFDWISDFKERRVSAQATEHLNQFLIRLRGLGTDELALLAAQTADVCRHVHGKGMNLLQPHAVLLQHPGLETELSRVVLDLQRGGKEVYAPGFMVWAHTLRAEQRIELLYLAKEMWTYVQRGFPDAKVAAIDFQIATGHDLIVRDDFLQVPQGFTAN